jgi:hypothetical protein
LLTVERFGQLRRTELFRQGRRQSFFESEGTNELSNRNPWKRRRPTPPPVIIAGTIRRPSAPQALSGKFSAKKGDRAQGGTDQRGHKAVRSGKSPQQRDPYKLRLSIGGWPQATTTASAAFLTGRSTTLTAPAGSTIQVRAQVSHGPRHNTARVFLYDKPPAHPAKNLEQYLHRRFADEVSTPAPSQRCR